MKLLIVTQKVDSDDPVLGSFHHWLEGFAAHVDEVFVIAGSLGRTDLPSNVILSSFGKDRGLSKLSRIWEFCILFSRYYAKADAVFFHMIPEFVVAASPFLVSRKRPRGLWYVHKSKTMWLLLAEHMVTYIFTASPLSFRHPSKKIIFTGHAIDTDAFRPPQRGIPHQNGLRMITVGRISPVKNVDVIIKAASIFRKVFDRPWFLSIVGGPVLPKDVSYFEYLKNLVKELGLSPYVNFEGPRPYHDIPGLYQEHDMFISVSGTGSVDKAVLEAMSSGLTVITSNEAFQPLLPAKYFLQNKSPEFLAERIKALADENRPVSILRDVVLSDHGLKKTIKKIVDTLHPRYNGGY